MLRSSANMQDVVPGRLVWRLVSDRPQALSVRAGNNVHSDAMSQLVFCQQHVLRATMMVQDSLPEVMIQTRRRSTHAADMGNSMLSLPPCSGTLLL
jgi:hypothetical protein